MDHQQSRKGAGFYEWAIGYLNVCGVFNFSKSLHICCLSVSPQKPYEVGGRQGRKEVSDLLGDQEGSSCTDRLQLTFFFPQRK